MAILGTVTIPDIVSFNACDSESANRMEELFAGKETINAFDILAMEMPFEHKIWLMFRPELIDQETLELIKQDFIDLMTDKENLYYQRAVKDVSVKVVNKFINYHGESYDSLSNDLETTITNVILKRINNHGS